MWFWALFYQIGATDSITVVTRSSGIPSLPNGIVSNGIEFSLNLAPGGATSCSIAGYGDVAFTPLSQQVGSIGLSVSLSPSFFRLKILCRLGTISPS
jgi:hypothetical protein